MVEIYEDGWVNVDGAIMEINEAKKEFPQKRELIEYHQIKKAIDEIVALPQIANATNDMERAYQLYKYIIESSTYDLSILQEKQKEIPTEETLQFKEIYKCLCEHRSICTGDSYALALLLRTIGISAVHVGIKNKPQYQFDEKTGQRLRGHMVVKFTLGEQEYFCDPTTFRDVVAQTKTPLNQNLFAFPKQVFFGALFPKKEISYDKFKVLSLKEMYNAFEQTTDDELM